jgi:hypothetical protein
MKPIKHFGDDKRAASRWQFLRRQPQSARSGEMIHWEFS